MAMTSIYYTECGHWGRRDFSGSSRSRERYAESLGEGELCPDCKREALLKKREAEVAEAVKAAEEKNWPDLLGSEKQIAWATTIRAQVVNGDKDNYCFIYKDKVYKLKREAVSGIVESVLIKEKIDSKFWIDNRNNIEAIRQKAVKEFSDKYADEFTEILKAAEEIEPKNLKYMSRIYGLGAASIKEAVVASITPIPGTDNYSEKVEGKVINLFISSRGEIDAEELYNESFEIPQIIKKIKREMRAADKEDLYVKLAVAFLEMGMAIYFDWIEENEAGNIVRVYEKEKELRDKALKLAMPSQAEETVNLLVIPDNRTENRVVDISISSNAKEVVIPVIDEPGFRKIASGLGFIWSPGYFSKKIGLKTGKASDLIAEAGAAYLKNGYAVEFPDAESKKKAEDGDYERDILNSVKYSPKINKLLIYTRFYEDCDADALKTICRKTRGSEYHWSRVAVPLSAADMVLDYAKKNDYTVCGSAKEAIEGEKAYIESKEFGEEYILCTIPDKLIEKYPSLLKNIKFTGKEEKDDIGFVSVHVDRTFDDEKISLSYSLMEMKYKDYKKWNSSHEESEQLILAGYDEETKIARVYVPDKRKKDLEPDPETLKKYGDRNKQIYLVKEGYVKEAILSVPEVIDADALEVEVPKCLQN